MPDLDEEEEEEVPMANGHWDGGGEEEEEEEEKDVPMANGHWDGGGGRGGRRSYG